MEPVLSEEQALLREGAVKLCREAGGPKRARELRNAGKELDADAWKLFVQGGWLDPGALGMFELSLVLEEAGRQLLALPLLEVCAAGKALVRADRSTTPGDILVPALPHRAWSGKDDGPVTFDGKAVSGRVRFVRWAPSAGAFLVAAQDALCIVRKGAGVSIATLANVDGSTSSDVTLKNAPAEAVASGAKARELEAGMREMLELGAAAELTGVTAAALDMTLDHIKMRHQFGKALGSFQALQHRAADCFVEIELNRSLVYKVCSAWDAGQCHPAMVSAAKARATRCALEMARTALQLHGAIGYTDEHDIGLYYKRAVALAALYGNEMNHTGRFSELTLADA